VGCAIIKGHGSGKLLGYRLWVIELRRGIVIISNSNMKFKGCKWFISSEILKG
jgi:hypothetical protein